MFAHSSNFRDHLRVAAVVVAASVFVFLFVVSARVLFVGWRVYRADRPIPARLMDTSQDRFQIRDVQKALRYHLQRTCRDVCGLSAIHLGLPLQLALMRTFDNRTLWLQNPQMEIDSKARWEDADRTVGSSDPLCRKSLVHRRYFKVATKVHVQSEDALYTLTDADARCAQQLLWHMRMSSSDDWPCELSDWRAVEYLSMNLEEDM